jgi:hypothetical protein
MRSNYAPIDPSTTTSSGILTEKDMLEQYDISLVKSIINHVGPFRDSAARGAIRNVITSVSAERGASDSKYSLFTLANALLKIRNIISD